MRKYIFTTALLSLLAVTTVVAAKSSQQLNTQLLIVSSDISLEKEVHNKKNQLESRYFTLVTSNKEINTNLNQLGVDLELNIEETKSNKLSNLASFITKQENYTYNTALNLEQNLSEKILKTLELPINPIEPTLTLQEGNFKVNPGESGYEITNLKEIEASILSAIEANQNSSISVFLKENKPMVSNQSLLSQAKQISEFSDLKLTLQTTDRFEKEVKISKTDLSLDYDQGLKISDNSFNTLLTDLQERLEQEKSDLTILNIDQKTGAIDVEGDLINGKKINKELLRDTINKSLISGNQQVLIPLEIEEALVINKFNDSQFTLIGSGISNYKGSGPGRVHNIQFASDERYKTIYLPQGQTFKFNSYLGGPVTLSRGWANAYVISGGEIVPAPGGGICQMSTTFYRAALQAGLQIDKASNHSLYVHYYSAYGDGLDAAIFPGSKDLHFTNNTPGDIILHSYYDSETQDLVVNVIGIDDGRKTELFGPFTAGDNNDNPFGVTTRTNQINWVRQITNSKGDLQQETFTSTYSKFYRY